MKIFKIKGGNGMRVSKQFRGFPKSRGQMPPLYAALTVCIIRTYMYGCMCMSVNMWIYTYTLCGCSACKCTYFSA